jgi:predicted DNA-binding transcriptional regulator YafY
VQFSPSLARVVTDTLRHPTQKVEKCPDGSVIWSVSVANLDEVRWWLMGFGSGVKILNPQALQKRFWKKQKNDSPL